MCANICFTLIQIHGSAKEIYEMGEISFSISELFPHEATETGSSFYDVKK